MTKRIFAPDLSALPEAVETWTRVPYPPEIRMEGYSPVKMTQGSDGKIIYTYTIYYEVAARHDTR